METKDLPALIKRCLVHGVRILPFQLETVLRKYNQYKIPDEVLNKMSDKELTDYVGGLYLCGQEDARDWTRGHEALKTLGFKETERTEGHRVFVGLIYQKQC